MFTAAPATRRPTEGTHTGPTCCSVAPFALIMLLCCFSVAFLLFSLSLVCLTKPGRSGEARLCDIFRSSCCSPLGETRPPWRSQAVWYSAVLLLFSCYAPWICVAEVLLFPCCCLAAACWCRLDVILLLWYAASIKTTALPILLADSFHQCWQCSEFLGHVLQELGDRELPTLCSGLALDPRFVLFGVCTEKSCTSA